MLLQPCFLHALESGYLDLPDWQFARSGQFTPQHMRAVVESLLAFGIWAVVLGDYQSLPTQSGRATCPISSFLAGLVLLVCLAFLEPVLATKMARWAIVALSIAGFVFAIVALRRNGRNHGQRAAVLGGTPGLDVSGGQRGGRR